MTGGADRSEVSLAVVSPMANEADTAARFVEEVLEHCRSYGFREIALFVVLDRASHDGTLELLRELAPRVPELRVVWAPENRGVVDAYFRGYREALAWHADWILEIDGGFSHLPSEIPRFLDQIHSGCDCVFATRFAAGGVYRGGIGARFLVSWLGSWLSRVLLGMRQTDMTSGFQFFSRKALERVVGRGVRSHGPFFQTEIKTYLRDLDWREVPITYVPTGQAARRTALVDAGRVLMTLFFERLRGPSSPSR